MSGAQVGYRFEAEKRHSKWTELQSQHTHTLIHKISQRQFIKKQTKQAHRANCLISAAVTQPAGWAWICHWHKVTLGSKWIQRDETYVEGQRSLLLVVSQQPAIKTIIWQQAIQPLLVLNVSLPGSAVCVGMYIILKICWIHRQTLCCPTPTKKVNNKMHGARSGDKCSNLHKSSVDCLEESLCKNVQRSLGHNGLWHVTEVKCLL